MPPGSQRRRVVGHREAAAIVVHPQPEALIAEGDADIDALRRRVLAGVAQRLLQNPGELIADRDRGLDGGHAGPYRYSRGISPAAADLAHGLGEVLVRNVQA